MFPYFSTSETWQKQGKSLLRAKWTRRILRSEAAQKKYSTLSQAALTKKSEMIYPNLNYYSTNIYSFTPQSLF